MQAFWNWKLFLLVGASDPLGRRTTGLVITEYFPFSQTTTCMVNAREISFVDQGSRNLAMTAKPVKAASRAVATPRQFALFA